jgi:hypothetical protein
MRDKMSQIRELVLLAVLCIAPMIIAHKAAAQTIEVIWCDGYSIGAFCSAVTDDPTICQDCASTDCDESCIQDGPDAWRYCLDISFASCINSMVVEPFWQTIATGSVC